MAGDGVQVTLTVKEWERALRALSSHDRKLWLRIAERLREHAKERERGCDA